MRTNFGGNEAANEKRYFRIILPNSMKMPPELKKCSAVWLKSIFFWCLKRAKRSVCRRSNLFWLWQEPKWQFLCKYNWIPPFIVLAGCWISSEWFHFSDVSFWVWCRWHGSSYHFFLPFKRFHIFTFRQKSPFGRIRTWLESFARQKRNSFTLWKWPLFHSGLKVGQSWLLHLCYFCLHFVPSKKDRLWHAFFLFFFATEWVICLIFCCQTCKTFVDTNFTLFVFRYQG